MSKVKSWVWNYAKRVGDKAYCDLCEENSNNEFSCVGGTTGSVLRHLKIIVIQFHITCSIYRYNILIIIYNTNTYMNICLSVKIY